MSFRSLFFGFAVVLFACGGATAEDPARNGRTPPPEGVAAPPPGGSANGPGDPSAVPSPASSNDRCASPRPLALVDGKLELNDETMTASDEFSTLDCASRGTADTLVGPQRYYRLSVRRGRTYRFMLTPPSTP